MLQMASRMEILPLGHLTLAARQTLWLLLASLVSMSSAQIEQIESRPLDGHKFTQGQSFRIECRAVTGQELAIRLACPLAEFASGGLATTSCFENCGRPLCNQPNLNDCSATMPELLAANCNRTVSQVSPSAKEIAIVYTFNKVNTRHSGSYMCQFKTMRSSSYIIVDPVTTTTTTTTTRATTATTATTITTHTTASTSSTSATTAAASTASTVSSSTTGHSASSLKVATTAARITEKMTTASPKVESTIITKENLLTLPPGPKTPQPTTRQPDEFVTSRMPLLKSGGWFYASVIGTLSGADVILVCLLILVATAWLIGFLCIRCQVLTDRYKFVKPNGGCCCSSLLCLCHQQQQRQQQDAKHQQRLLTANGGLRKFAEEERQRGAARLTAMHMNAPTAATSAHSVSSGQVYAEPDGASYYSPDGGDGGELQHPLVLAGGGGHPSDDPYYRLQQDFDDPLVRGGYGTNPRSTFFPRDQTGRHSFHNATPAARQRPAIPRDMILSGGAKEDVDAEAEAAAELVAAAVDPVMTRDDFRRQMEQQRREIASLRQQLRNSQLQLNQRASSTAALRQQQQQQPQQQPQQQQQQQQPPTPLSSPTSGEYDLLMRTSAADALPPSPLTPPPPAQQQQQRQQKSSHGAPAALQTLPNDTDEDLPPLPPPPMASDSDNVENSRGSLGKAYGTGQRY